MHKQHTIWAWLVVGLLSFAGCGDRDEAQAPGTNAANDAGTEPHPGEVVVEIRQTGSSPNREAGSDSELVQTILTEPRIQVPAGYAVEIDKTKNRPDQITFVVRPKGGDVSDAAATKAAAEQVFEQLALQFRTHSLEALRAEYDHVSAQAESAKADVKRHQNELISFHESRRGLEATGESERQRHIYKRRIDLALETQIKLEDRAKALKRLIDRGRIPELQRLR